MVDKITELVLSHEKVLGLHDLLVHDYGPGRCYASAHVELSADEDPMACHDIIDDIECDVLEKMNVHFVIHYDPVVQNDAEQNEMRRTVGEIVRGLNPAFSIHDFRIVRGSAQSKLVFDLAVPYSMIERKKEIKEQSKLTQEEWVEFTKQIWHIPIPNKSDVAFGKHPAIMPSEIPYRLIKLFSFVGDTVLDPFAGSGTTLKAAKELKRHYIGYELYENYKSVIEEKLKDKGQK